MKKMTILEWNINQRGGRAGGVIPSWVKNEVGNFDLAVLTEFCTKCKGRDAFVEDLKQRGYACVCSENGGGNDVLIAVKREFPILKTVWEPCYAKDSVPENLRVDIDCHGQKLTVAGIRIKTIEQMTKRKQEFKWALKWLENVEGPVLITGDCNNNRRDTTNTDWSLRVMEEQLEKKGFHLHTPAGSSIYEECPRYHEFAYDHFAARNVTLSGCAYLRDFTGRDPGYVLGRDFREPWYPGAKSWSVPPSLPDHAMLVGELSF